VSHVQFVCQHDSRWSNRDHGTANVLIEPLIVIHSHSSVLIVRRTQRLTLFPYTTLFRSRAVGAAPRRTRPRARPLGERRSFADIDRKRTRLNSSHLGMSYAVLRWKKKDRVRPYGDREWIRAG